VALVSGAGPGLGRAICLRFAAEGAKLVIGDVSEPSLSGALDAVAAMGGEAVGQLTDITAPDQCEALVALGVQRFGALDLLVNDAYHGGDYRRF
jgi:NAD(P)-dependent dehydrogenase (short-subunit alcohol dehydrogenase family)